MRWCQKHWDALRQAIDARGLSHLIAKDGKTAMESMRRELEGVADDSDFDPLMGAWNRVNARIIEIRGLMYMMPDAPHNGCPLCEPDATNPNWAENWIEGVADEALYNARLRGLVPEAH